MILARFDNPLLVGVLLAALALAGCSSGGNQPPPGGGLDGAAVLWLPYSTEDGSVVATAGPDLAVDAQGGLHAAYTITTGLDAGRRPAYYLGCAATCGDPKNWRRTRLGDAVAEVRLQLDPAGRPRLMLYLDISTGPDDLRYTYLYAACDAGCDDAANWTLTPLLTSYAVHARRSEYVNHYFALDAEGRPGFVYSDFNNPSGHAGTFYAFCAGPVAGCREAASWRENRIYDGVLWDPDLSFDRDGRPRILAHVIDVGQNLSKLAYVECAAECAEAEGALLYDSDGFSRYSLAWTAAGGPRVAYYTGAHGKDLEPAQLYYLACDAGCTDPQRWSALNLRASPGNGWSVDLALDAQDRPRFVYKLGDVGPGFAWCDAACETDTAGWRSKLVEDRAVLDRDFPVWPVVDCTISTWTSGHTPVLALDPKGDPRVAFVAKHQYGGTDTRPGHIGEPCPVQTDIKLVRLGVLPRP